MDTHMLAVNEGGTEPARIDVIVPVFNALDQVKECIGSLLACGDAATRIIVVDDGSHPHVRDWLVENLTDLPNCLLLLQPKNLGYLQAINRGLDECDSDIVICQNSDTIVFEGFYDRIRATFLSDPKIGIINPVSVWANWSRIPFPPGHTIYSLAAHLWEQHGATVTDISIASGFCFAIRAEALRSIGPFDLAFDPGYWEETDFCMKALANGWRVVAAPGLFVFHHGWSSFGAEHRNAYMERNERVFRARWGEQYKVLENSFRMNDPLRRVKAQLGNTNQHTDNVFTRRTALNSIAVLYLLPNMGLYGGIISVTQVVNQLVLLGLDAGVAVVGGVDNKALRYGPCYFHPLTYESDSQFLENCPTVDVIVATHWSTSYIAIKAVNSGRAKRAAYFVQDYEPDFHLDDPVKSRMAKLSYSLIENRICKTLWLKNKLDAFGGNNILIPLGLNTDIFADHGHKRDPMLIAMARPSSPRRNWATTRKVLDLLVTHRPELRCGVYGFGFKANELPAGIENFGLLASASEVANTLNKATILLDASTYQGFGRPGIEAIACGVVPVLTKNGGITSYAKHLENCLLIEPFDIVGIVESICRLLDDPNLFAKLRENGRKLASNYPLRQEGIMTKAFLEHVAAG